MLCALCDVVRRGVHGNDKTQHSIVCVARAFNLLQRRHAVTANHWERETLEKMCIRKEQHKQREPTHIQNTNTKRLRLSTRIVCAQIYVPFYCPIFMQFCCVCFIVCKCICTRTISYLFFSIYTHVKYFVDASKSINSIFGAGSEVLKKGGTIEVRTFRFAALFLRIMVMSVNHHGPVIC